MSHKFFALLLRVSAYLPLIGTALILLAATFDANIFQAVPLSLLLAVMTTSFILTVVYLETQLRENSEITSRLQRAVLSMEKTQRQYLDATAPAIQTASLGQAFQLASVTINHISQLRVFAISSQQILGFIRFHSFYIDQCTVLVRGFAEDDDEHRDFRKQIELVVRDWRALERDGRIRHLSIRSYDFFPTEYECIFDKQCLFLGLYESDPEDYSEVRVRDVVVVENSTPAGRQMINEYVERYDRLFAICEGHHGPNRYDSVLYFPWSRLPHLLWRQQRDRKNTHAHASQSLTGNYTRLQRLIDQRQAGSRSKRDIVRGAREETRI